MRQKLSSIVDIDTIKAIGSMTGECLVHRKEPEVNATDAYFLAPGEVCEIDAGKSFALMKNTDSNNFQFDGYMALEAVKLEGPLVWSEIETPETVVSRLNAVDHEKIDDELMVIVAAFLSFIFVLIVVTYSVLLDNMSQLGQRSLMVGSAIAFGFLLPWGLRALYYGAKNDFKLEFLHPDANVFTNKKEYEMSRDILKAASEKNIPD
jgi:hypothetical protein